MTEPISEKESHIVTNPQWVKLDADSLSYLSEGVRKWDFVVDENVISYPAINGEFDPLGQVHRDLFVALSAGKEERLGLAFDLASTEKGFLLLYFAVPKERQFLLGERDKIIQEANNIIATVGGNKFVPERINF